MEEGQKMSSMVISHLLQRTLRSLCVHESSPWIYAVYWRILPRSFPPPKWDLAGGARDGARVNTRRNWILAWEDGFCNFAACSTEPASSISSPASLQPELFFKMSHEIYNFGEGLIGKVAEGRSHMWVYNEPLKQEDNILTSSGNTVDSHPRTWEAQFQSGIKTIALIAIREGVVQLGAVQKVVQDVSFVVSLRKKFAYLETIPGVLLPHPSSSVFSEGTHGGVPSPDDLKPITGATASQAEPPSTEFYDHFGHQLRMSLPMGSLEALLSNLPSVGPVAPEPTAVAAGTLWSAMSYDTEEIVLDEDAIKAMELI